MKGSKLAWQHWRQKCTNSAMRVRTRSTRMLLLAHTVRLSGDSWARQATCLTALLVWSAFPVVLQTPAVDFSQVFVSFECMGGAQV